jgi:hypothetical protein
MGKLLVHMTDSTSTGRPFDWLKWIRWIVQAVHPSDQQRQAVQSRPQEDSARRRAAGRAAGREASSAMAALASPDEDAASRPTSLITSFLDEIDTSSGDDDGWFGRGGEQEEEEEVVGSGSALYQLSSTLQQPEPEPEPVALSSAGLVADGCGTPQPARIYIHQAGLRCTGGWVWEGALELERYLLRRWGAQLRRGARVLELGSGVGYLAMRLASVVRTLRCLAGLRCAPPRGYAWCGDACTLVTLNLAPLTHLCCASGAGCGGAGDRADRDAS